ncbi:hypothetical protein [Paenibacillus physcomitrellae]|uniref:hypothetical protein n=1 Tax=Paenibacillus physcomitrellae TaxID=1619311 RepID=UPI0012FDB425|nr:hypothetical protein [Paenibacillus physcomitrellae]
MDNNLLQYRGGGSLRLLWLRDSEDRHLMNTIRLKAREAQMGFFARPDEGLTHLDRE